MKSFHANLGAGIDGLSVREHDIPEPGPTEVLVQVHAASLSFRELMILRGWYPLPVKPDVVPISDGAGEVIAVGERVTRAAVGDRVTASIFPRWIDGRFALEVAAQLGGSLDGMLTEYTLLGEDALVRIPDHLSYEEGATLPCAAVAAWNALTGGRGAILGNPIWEGLRCVGSHISFSSPSAPWAQHRHRRPQRCRQAYGDNPNPVSSRSSRTPVTAIGAERRGQGRRVEGENRHADRNAHHNARRSHRGLDLKTPDHRPDPAPRLTGGAHVRRRERTEWPYPRVRAGGMSRPRVCVPFTQGGQSERCLTP